MRSMAPLRCIGIFINVSFKVDRNILILDIKYGQVACFRLTHWKTNCRVQSYGKLEILCDIQTENTQLKSRTSCYSNPVYLDEVLRKCQINYITQAWPCQENGMKNWRSGGISEPHSEANQLFHTLNTSNRKIQWCLSPSTSLGVQFLMPSTCCALSRSSPCSCCAEPELAWQSRAAQTQTGETHWHISKAWLEMGSPTRSVLINHTSILRD